MGKLSIIIPVYNEEKTVKTVLEKVSRLTIDKEIIVVNDGSTDNTAEVLRTCQSSVIRVQTHTHNRGKGAAIRTALTSLTGDVVAIQDADLEYNPEELVSLAQLIFDKEAEVVFGSRFLKRNPCLYRRFYYGNKLISAMISIIAGKHISDSYTCYKVFKRDIIVSFPLTSCGFEIEAELSMRVALGNYRFKEIPISYSPRTLREGKKISWFDALKAVSTALKIRFLGKLL